MEKTVKQNKSKQKQYKNSRLYFTVRNITLVLIILQFARLASNHMVIMAIIRYNRCQSIPVRSYLIYILLHILSFAKDTKFMPFSTIQQIGSMHL